MFVYCRYVVIMTMYYSIYTVYIHMCIIQTVFGDIHKYDYV